jgi:GNAT superfamily N-acetyltransferase
VTQTPVRTYADHDESGWLRCRVLSFLGTAYFDDVATSRPRYDEPSVELVSVLDGAVVGVLDLTLPDDAAEAATVETVAVHPDHQGAGIGTALLTEAVRRAQGRCAEVEAWTRDDAGTLAWYRSRGFTEDSHYLHVHVDHDEEVTPEGDRLDGMRLVKGFFHSDLDREAELRRRFRRVHVCRRMAAPLDALLP